MRVLVTCPPMLGQFAEFVEPARKLGLELEPAEVLQTLSEAELMELVPAYDGWIIGDDPATCRVLQAGRKGSLKAAVKWGIGVDNVDFDACSDLGIPVTNTPLMFGAEVADVAMAYITGLARGLFAVDRAIRERAQWPKPAGMSLSGKTVALVGHGDVGRNLAKRLQVSGMRVVGYDPGVQPEAMEHGVEHARWPERLDEADFIVLTCSLTPANRHMLNAQTIAAAPRGVFVVNVARGPLIDETALVAALESGHVAGAALDVFEEEPLPADSPLRAFPACIFGSHNGSNTVDAVRRASLQAIEKLAGLLHG